MPELPEVEVVTRSLKKTIKNHKIIKITVNNRNLRFCYSDEKTQAKWSTLFVTL